MRNRLFLFGWSLSVVSLAYASPIVIRDALPNTADDAAYEYIEIQNVSCIPQSLSGVTVRDASGKEFRFPDEMLDPGAIRMLSRSESKIILNNVDETLDLLDASGSVFDHVAYSASTKDVPVTFGSGSLDPCPVPPVLPADPEPDEGDFPVESTGSTESGTLIADTGSLDEIPPLTDTGILNEDTGSTDTGILIESTGSIDVESTDTGSVSVELIATGALVPILPVLLFLSDADNNGKIDRLEVEYSAMLTGTIHPEKLALYSDTGGLSSQKIETSSGVFRSLSLSGNLLVVDLVEQDLFHLDLSISSSTKSHLRLKSYAGFGISGLSGEPAEAITYTTSFDGYDKDKIINLAYTPPPPAVSGTPNVSYIAPVGSAPLGMRYLPPAKIAVQSGLTDAFVCRASPCRVNLLHETQFSYERCEWNLWAASSDGASRTSCNPRTFEWSGTGTFQVSLLVYEEGNRNNFQTESLILSAILPASPIFDLKSAVQSVVSDAAASGSGAADKKKKTAPKAKAPAKKKAAAKKKPAVKKKAATPKKKVSAKKKAPAKKKPVAKKVSAPKVKIKKTSSGSAQAPVAKDSEAEDILSQIQISAVVGTLFSFVGYLVGRTRKDVWQKNWDT